MGFRVLDHVADVMIEAWGNTLEEAFEESAKAMFDQMIFLEKVDQLIEYPIEVRGYDLEELLYNWLEQLIIAVDVEFLVFSKFKVTISGHEGNYKLNAVCWGEKYKREKHGSKVVVKAITYHEMKIEKANNLWIIRYILDI